MFGLEIPTDEREPFNKTVWKIVAEIPSGKVTTYGQIAGYIPCPAQVSPEDFQANRARWVGNAMAASPKGVPWQRVINASGKISVRQGSETQKKLLVSEGVVFDAKDRIDLKKFGWEGPTPDWLRDNHLIVPDKPQQLTLL
jgi:methylated-DNA-protein-cysteine methyltransferase-like protein